MHRLLLYCGFLLLGIGSCHRSEAPIYPEQKPLREYVYATAMVEPAEEYEVYSAISGVIERCLIEEGDRVEQGSTLFVLQRDVPKSQLAEAQLSYEIARTNVRPTESRISELQEQISAARLQLQNDSQLMVRQERLWKQGIGSLQERDQRQLKYELSRSQLQTLQEQLGRARRELDDQLRLAAQRVESKQAVAGEYRIQSLIDGRVYQLLREAGESVTPQQPLAIIGSADAFQVELEIDEEDIGRIQLGQTVYFTLEAFPDSLFQGHIYRINPYLHPLSRTFIAEAQFDRPLQQPYSGLTGEANILIREHSDALVVPIGYVSDQQTVLTDTGWVRVETGIRTLEYVEILSGLSPQTPIRQP